MTNSVTGMTNRLGYARVSTLEQDPASQLAAAGPASEGRRVVVWHLDRLGRSSSHLFEPVTELGERGVGFHSPIEIIEIIATTTLTGRLLFGIVASLAAFERELIRERTMAGLAVGRRS